MSIFKKKIAQIPHEIKDFTDEDVESIKDEVSELIEDNIVSVNRKQVSREGITENCEQIKEAIDRIEEAKLEYQAVTAYLSDIQKIDMMLEDSRHVVNDAARNIVTLSRERAKYQTSDVKLTDLQFKNIAKYEKTMVQEIRNIQKNEEYGMKIKSDLRHLEGEKGALKFERQEIIENQKNLKNLAIIATSLILVMDMILLFLNYKMEKDMKLPMILSCVLAMGIACFIVYDARKNRREMLMNDKKMNKAIGILNKVKIKYVNNQNALDYAYEKFMVRNSMQLQDVWEKYVIAKKEAEKYKDNSELLNFYNNRLVKELDKVHLHDSEVWIYQALALIDNREMVEIRHRLNERRQKLRQTIDFNYEIKEKSLKNLKKIAEINPKYKDRIDEVLNEWKISEKI